MSTPVNITLLGRREFVLGGSAATALAAWLALAAGQTRTGQPQTTPATVRPDGATPTWRETYRRLIGDAKPVEGRITLELPTLADNGNLVPFVVSIDSPMTEADYVKAIHVISTANLVPTIASFRLSPQSGAAYVASRMRLAESQDVIVLAELSTAQAPTQFLVTKRTVNVAIGGCGG